jgi:hypothetical protein
MAHGWVPGETPGPFFDQVTRLLLNRGEIGAVAGLGYHELLASQAPISMFVITPHFTDSAALQVGQAAQRWSPTTSVVMVRDPGWDGQLKDALRNGIHAVVSDGSARSLRETLEWALDRTARLQHRKGLTGAWVDDWLDLLPERSVEDERSRKIAVLAAGRPEEFRELVARALGVPLASVASVFGCAATEEHLMAVQGAVDVVVVSPDLRWPDILPMADFIHRSYPATAVIVVREDGTAQLPSSFPGISATLSVDEGPAGLRNAVRRILGTPD